MGARRNGGSIPRPLPPGGTVGSIIRASREWAGPYPYKSAKEHYEALLAKAKAHGGPTVYTKATTPDWDGFYIRDPNGTADSPGFTGPDRMVAGPGRGERWQWGGIEQALNPVRHAADPRSPRSATFKGCITRR